MSQDRDINAPVRIVLLGSNTPVGKGLAAFMEDKPGCQLRSLGGDALLANADAMAVLSGMECDVLIDAFSLSYVLDKGYKSALENIDRWAAEYASFRLMISSVEVFSGEKHATYDESDIADSSTEYGLALAQVERQVLQGEHNIVLRTGWIFSGQPDGQVFKTIEQALVGHSDIPGDNNVGCPTSVSDLGRVVLSVVKQRHYGALNSGVYHYCCAEEISQLGFTQAILAAAQTLLPGVQPQLEWVAEELQKNSEEQIDLRQSLSCRKIFNHFGIKQRPWRPSLRKMVKKLYQVS